jgi:hypothetical protein
VQPLECYKALKSCVGPKLATIHCFDLRLVVWDSESPPKTGSFLDGKGGVRGDTNDSVRRGSGRTLRFNFPGRYFRCLTLFVEGITLPTPPYDKADSRALTMHTFSALTTANSLALCNSMMS